MGVKLLSKHDGDQVTPLWGWIERTISLSFEVKYSNVDHIMEGGPIMWISLATIGNQHLGK